MIVSLVTALAFSKFYAACPTLGADRAETKVSRLALGPLPR